MLAVCPRTASMMKVNKVLVAGVIVSVLWHACSMSVNIYQVTTCMEFLDDRAQFATLLLLSCSIISSCILVVAGWLYWKSIFPPVPSKSVGRRLASFEMTDISNQQASPRVDPRVNPRATVIGRDIPSNTPRQHTPSRPLPPLPNVTSTMASIEVAGGQEIARRHPAFNSREQETMSHRLTHRPQQHFSRHVSRRMSRRNMYRQVYTPALRSIREVPLFKCRQLSILINFTFRSEEM